MEGAEHCYVYLDDRRFGYRLALEAGASHREPVQPYGDRTAGFEDHLGHYWWTARRSLRVSSAIGAVPRLPGTAAYGNSCRATSARSPAAPLSPPKRFSRDWRSGRELDRLRIRFAGYKPALSAIADPGGLFARNAEASTGAGPLRRLARAGSTGGAPPGGRHQSAAASFPAR